MSLLSLSYHYIRQNWLNTLLNTILLGLGIGMIVFLILVEVQIQENFRRNIKGIKMVVGAKGSPLQLILCNVYHLDNPTGNISLAEAQAIAANPRFVKKAIPLALGDNYAGFRIVGTNAAFLAHYHLRLARGKIFDRLMEVTIGAEVARATGLRLGDTFHSAHGLAEEAEAESHEAHHFKVVGILQKSGTVADQLLLTGIPAFWLVHQEGQAADTPPWAAAGKPLPDILKMPPENHQITALLITEYRNPLAAINLPRQINQHTSLQAALPALEVNRIFEQLGVGTRVIGLLAYILIGLAALSTFIALYNALRARHYDLAILRSLGATRGQLFGLMLLEGWLLACLGLALGLATGHLTVEWIGHWEGFADKLALTGWRWENTEYQLIILIFGVGFLAALLPAWQSYRLEVGKILGKANG
ncbi:MAG: FtsX-like permease family protein [Microscillaceae bacterium]|nr:FtsX-like permease family protein [Microscillaceae bacterium]